MYSFILFPEVNRAEVARYHIIVNKSFYYCTS